MITQEISYRTKGHIFGDGNARGVLVFLTEEELRTLKKLDTYYKNKGLTETMLEKILERTKPATKINPDYPEGKYTSMIYQNEYTAAVDKMLLYMTMVGSIIKI